MFPVINHINDVLPHIEGYDEIVVIDKDTYIVIDYNFMDSGTFTSSKQDELCHGSKIRRECRGLVFNKDGTVLSRAFHKFFNVGERQETLAESIDWSRPHTVTIKRDGSLLRPLVFPDGQFRLGTRKGVTDVACMAENYMIANPQFRYRELCEEANKLNLTCMFEFHSLENMVVIDYERSFMELLAVRDNRTGVYISYDKIKELGEDYDVPVVPMINADLSQPNEFLSKVRDEVDSEGYVITFNDGQTVKVKNDWYVQLHHVVSGLNQERNIVRLALSNELDDILAVLPDNRKAQVEEFANTFWDRYKLFKSSCFDAWNRVDSDVLADGDFSRKAYALQIQREDKYIQPVLFKFLDVEVLSEREELLRAFVLNKTNKTKVFDEFIEWLME